MLFQWHSWEVSPVTDLLSRIPFPAVSLQPFPDVNFFFPGMLVLLHGPGALWHRDAVFFPKHTLPCQDHCPWPVQISAWNVPCTIIRLFLPCFQIYYAQHTHHFITRPCMTVKILPDPLVPDFSCNQNIPFYAPVSNRPSGNLYVWLPAYLWSVPG